MQTDDHTVFSGPLKHQKKENIQHHTGQIVVNSDHPNSHHLDGKHIAKVMNEDDHKPITMSHELKIAIAQGRQAKGWNQQQFAKAIEVKKTDLHAWQSGKQAPPGIMISKMQKVLGVKLPRPNKQHH